MARNRSWTPIMNRARTITMGYPYLITTRQLHYRLVAGAADLGYVNDQTCYKSLSEKRADLNRKGEFPDLLDQTRDIYQPNAWTSPGDGLKTFVDWYRRDRTEGQDYFIVLGGEKGTLLAQLNAWFDNDHDANEMDLGLPFILTRGFSSQTYVNDVLSMVLRDGRKPILIYAGDFDASGQDILRDWKKRCPVWREDNVIQIAVTADQIRPKTASNPNGLGLPVNPGKASDARTPAFLERHRALIDEQMALYPHYKWMSDPKTDKRGRHTPTKENGIQVEVEAIEPNILRRLYREALLGIKGKGGFWKKGAYDAVMEQEAADKTRLKQIAEDLEQEEEDD